MARLHVLIIAVPAYAAALLCASCSSSTTTSVVAPSAAKCAISASTSPSSFPAAGGTGSVAVSTTRDCTWSVASDSAWLSISGTHDGQGEATVPFSIAPNPAPAARSGAIVVGSDRQTVSQAGAPCHFELNRTSDSIGAAGGTLSVRVTTLAGCTWTAASSASWIAITSGRTASASGTVALSVAANADRARVGEVNIAGQTYTLSQNGVAPAPAPPPAGGSPGGGNNGGGGTTPTVVQVTGSVSDVSGSCPNLQFTVGDASVSTTAATTFVGGSCSDVTKKTDVTVTGTKGSDSTIEAQSVAILP